MSGKVLYLPKHHRLPIHDTSTQRTVLVLFVPCALKYIFLSRDIRGNTAAPASQSLNPFLEPNLDIDLLHSLLVSNSDATATEHSVHLFERKLAGLWHVEPDEGRSKRDEATEENEGAVGDPGDHVWCNLTDDARDC